MADKVRETSVFSKADFVDAGNQLNNLISEISKIYFGDKKIIKFTIAAFFSENHILLEDVPGIGKTTLAKALSLTAGTEISRIQCTPDLMPSDVVGFSMPEGTSGNFIFKKGPVFSNILIVDEINRASPRTQSAFLEAMEEHKITIEGTTYELPSPFFIIATQNPIEIAGTYPLPISQLDRFGIKLKPGYPGREKELLINHGISSEPVNKIISDEHFSRISSMINAVKVEDSLIDYVLKVGKLSRIESYIQFGFSPRALLSWLKFCKISAVMSGRNFIIPEDLHDTAIEVLSHRIHVKPEHRGLVSSDPEDIVRKLINSIPLPL